MRKYEYQKESREIAKLLGMTNAYMERRKAAFKVMGPLWALKQKTIFYFEMARVRYIIERARGYDLISKNDRVKLKDIWRSIFKRKYEPAR